MSHTSTQTNHLYVEKPSLIREESAHLSREPIPANKFAHLGTYKRPTQGLVGRLPDALVPYAELMRLHKFAGYYAIYYPHLFGLLYGAKITQPRISDLIWSHTILALGCVTLRGAACTWNDTLDAPLDREVARCRHRPVARSAVSVPAAHVFTALQTGACLGLLALLPRACALPAMILVLTPVLYPFCKRFSNYPQVVLGFSMALGQLVGAASVGFDVFAIESSKMTTGVVCLYMSNVINTIIYDTIYAHQDLQDDLKAGIHSMAVAVRGRANVILAVLSIIEVILLASAGHYLDFGFGHFVLGVGGTAVYLAFMLFTVQLDNQDCMRWFTRALHLSGIALTSGLVVDYGLSSFLS